MSDFNRQRRNLIIISVAIIIFVLAGGEIQKGSILGGTFTLDRKNILLLFGILAYLYSLWRYLLYIEIENFMLNLEKDYRKAYYKSSFYKKIATQHHPTDKEHGRNPAPPLRKHEGQWSLDYRFQFRKDGGRVQTQHKNIVAVKNFTAYRANFYLFFTVIFKERHVSETVLPFIIAALAALAIVYKLCIFFLEPACPGCFYVK